MAVAIELESAIADELAVTAALVQRSTVHVRNRGPGAGSGVIWESDGLIVTNAHVAHGTAATVELWDGRTFEARVTGRDAQRDLAALRVQGADLPAATVADSDELRVGQLVAAVGNPLGLTGARTLGIVHAIAPAEGHGSRTWVQADVRLAPGNSGGPLVDARGRVIGINSMIAGGLGLAVPSNAVRLFLGSQGERPQLGLSTQPVMARVDGQSRSGLLILHVVPDSPADRAGLMVGDVLIGIGRRAVTGPNDLLALLQQMAGITVPLEIIRGGARLTRDARFWTGDDSAVAREDAGEAA
ncbi:MAG: trypsin-like peptidase domain-containing protein [Chloroflexi bacterium]|nr:trypsin-like peptidase domain-containing protein [Chloroflexota bacterium]